MTMRHAAWFLLILLALTTCSLVYVMYLLLWPVKTIVIKNFSYTQPIHIETPVVHPGDIVKYDFDYCKFINVIPRSKSQLIDGQIIPLTPVMANSSGLPMGCHDTFGSVVIPSTINPGRYYLNKELDYQVNSLRTITVNYYTEYFQVVDKNLPSTSYPASTTKTEANPSPDQAKSVILSQ